MAARASPHAEEVEELGKGGSPQVPGQGSGVSAPPSCQPQVGGGAGRGPGPQSAQSEPAAGGRTRPGGMGAGGAGWSEARRCRGTGGGGALTQQQDVLPRGELGSRAGGDLAEDAGPNGEQGAR